MREQLVLMAKITAIDEEIAELQDELGDLPLQVREKENKVRTKQLQVDEVRNQLKEHEQRWADARIHLQELADRERTLADQQFQVRNNKEFDAMTREIAAIKQEQMDVEADLGSFHLKQQNLEAILADYEHELKRLADNLAEAEQELRKLSEENSSELADLFDRRRALSSQVFPDIMRDYERIHTLHNDPVVPLHRNNCSGCYSQIPPQTVVEIRKMAQIFTCENCGRFLYPDDLEIEE